MTDDNDQSDLDGDDTPPVQDSYHRTRGERTAGASVEDLLAQLGITAADLAPRDDAWWAERNKQLAEIDAQQKAASEAERIRRRARDLERAGECPRMYVESALNAPLDTPAMDFARRFQFLPSKIIVFAGGVGSGKTTAACWLALKGDDRDPGFISANELEQRGRYDKPLASWIQERTSLVIDDLGAESFDSKGHFRSMMDGIVERFHSRRRVLIMTTNLLPRVTDELRAEAKQYSREPEPQFIERYGDRVRSRVRQNGQWADCGMVDLRKSPPPDEVRP